MNKKLSLTILTFGFILTTITFVTAHDLWLVPVKFVVSPNAKVTVAMNTGDTFPVSEGAVKPERIERAAVITANGSTPLTTFRAEDKSTLADVTAPPSAGGAIVEVILKPIATKQPRASFDEFVKHEGLDAVAAQLARTPQRRAEERRTYAKYAKTLLRVGDGTGAATVYTRPLGHRLEIVPDTDPYALPSGEPLSVRLLFDGKPLVNARIVIGSTDARTATQSNMTGARTDAQGHARLQLGRAGRVHYIHALHMIPAAGRTDVEWESFWATITFKARR